MTEEISSSAEIQVAEMSTSETSDQAKLPKRKPGRPKGSKSKTKKVKVKPQPNVVAWDNASEAFKAWWMESCWTNNDRYPLLTQADYDDLEDAIKVLVMKWFDFDLETRATYTALFVPGTTDELVSQSDCLGTTKIPLDTNLAGRKTFSLVEREDNVALGKFAMFDFDLIESISALHMDGKVRDVLLEPESNPYVDDPFYAGESEDD